MSAFGQVLVGFDGLTDPSLADENGLIPDLCCRECGGGSPASELIDTLRSWKMIIYGHDQQESEQTNNQDPDNNQEPNATTPPAVTFPVAIRVWSTR